MAVLPAPNLIGAPARFSHWRYLQSEAVLAACDSTKRFVVQGAPTGFGKSLVYVSQGLLSDARTCILTSTKALQSQLLSDFAESGLVEIRGLNSYECNEGKPTGRFGDMRREGYRADRGLPMMCDEAPCQAGAWCPQREGGCGYYDANRKASMPNSKLVVTNYAYWMSINQFGEGLGPFDLLVLDEAHNAVDELGGFIGTELRQGEIESVLPGEATWLQPGATQEDWEDWAGYWNTRVIAAIDHTRGVIKEAERTGGKAAYGMLRRARELKRVQHKLSTIKNMRGEWVIDWQEDSRRRPIVKFDPVWPGEYAESTLFLGVPKVVMVSATVRPKTAEMLGIKLEDLDFREYPSSFPKENRPIIFIPSGHMNQKSAAASEAEWRARIDQIIERRTDRKGIIHTVSYPRATKIYMGSRYKGMMMVHDSENTREVIKRFRESKQPLVLVSPVLDTGYDFPGDLCRYQIISKMPFPVTVDKIMQARCTRDREYKDHVTAVKLMQMLGRINRAEDDWGESFIIDSDFDWWWRRSGQRLMANWIKEAIRQVQMLGPAMQGPVSTPLTAGQR